MSKLDNTTIPEVVFHTRAVNEAGEYDWKDVSTTELFGNKKVIVFSLPGAFTPTCSSTHLPGYEVNFDEFAEYGITDIYCLSVNDTFVLNAWAKDQGVVNIKMIPDGSGELTSKLGMLVKKDNIGFGSRSWRYSMLIENGVITKSFVEEGFGDNFGDDPFEVSDAQTMLDYLENNL